MHANFSSEAGALYVALPILEDCFEVISVVLTVLNETLKQEDVPNVRLFLRLRILTDIGSEF